MLVYTQMDARGTLLMQILGLPFYLTALLVGLAVSSLFPGAFLAVLFGAFFFYSFAYSKALYYFVHKIRPARPKWQFVASILAAQAVVLAAATYCLAA